MQFQVNLCNVYFYFLLYLVMLNYTYRPDFDIIYYFSKYETGSEKTSNFELFSKMSYCYQHVEWLKSCNLQIFSKATHPQVISLSVGFEKWLTLKTQCYWMSYVNLIASSIYSVKVPPTFSEPFQRSSAVRFARLAVWAAVICC